MTAVTTDQNVPSANARLVAAAAAAEEARCVFGWRIKGRSRRREEGKVRKEADARQQKERERINGLS